MASKRNGHRLAGGGGERGVGGTGPAEPQPSDPGAGDTAGAGARDIAAGVCEKGFGSTRYTGGPACCQYGQGGDSASSALMHSAWKMRREYRGAVLQQWPKMRICWGEQSVQLHIMDCKCTRSGEHTMKSHEANLVVATILASFDRQRGGSRGRREGDRIGDGRMAVGTGGRVNRSAIAAGRGAGVRHGAPQGALFEQVGGAGVADL